MIRVKTLHIEDFRGIRKLNLNLAGNNFGICGPNGTGKSGVVDAIEFCLTGDVTRLSGQGTASLSVKNHAPHVDQRTHPEKANVTITGDIPSLTKSFTIHRSVKNPKMVKITPPDAAIEGIITELEMHPEFALSRREIVKYIITPPGQRSIDVQTLLRLDHIERTRKTFTTFNNKCKNELDEAERNRIKAEVDLKASLKIDKLDGSLVLEKINENRKILGLPVLTELTKDTSFKTGIAAPQDADKKPSLSKVVAQADLSALQRTLQSGEPATLIDNRQAVKTALEKLQDDEQALTLAHRHGFIKTGLDLVTEDACPLCDTPWKADDLREYLRKKILSAEETEKLLGQLQTNINTILEALSERIQVIVRVIQYSESLKPPVQHIEIDTYLNNLREVVTALKDFLEDHSRVGPAITAVDKSWWSPATPQQVQINEL